MDNSIPPKVSAEEIWIVEHGVIGIKTSYRMTSDDTSDSYVTLTAFDGSSVTWRQETFNKVARMRSTLCGHYLCDPIYGLKYKVIARLAFDKENQAELSTYKRLKAKFENGEQK